MARYIAKRLAYIVLLFFVLSLLLYMIYHMLPYDRAATEAKALVKADPKAELDYETEYSRLQRKYGTDGNLLQRYGRWIGVYPFYDGSYKGLLQGNTGESAVYHTSVSEVIRAPLQNTVLVNGCTTVLALAITIPLGISSAVRRGSRRDTLVQAATIVGYSLPVFIIAILAIRVFSVELRWFPVSGMQTAGYTAWSPARQFWDRLYHLVLPVAVMTFCSLGGMTRYVRAAMIEALSLDCIRTARAKGLRERVVVYTHAWRNALIPIVTLIVGWFLGIFSGSLMVENIFSLNGIGRVYYEALMAKDNEVVLALQMFYILISLGGNLLIDLLYGFADPRIRVQV